MTLRFFPVMYPAAAHFVDTTIIRSLKKYTVGRSCRCLSIVEIIFQEYIMGTERTSIHFSFTTQLWKFLLKRTISGFDEKFYQLIKIQKNLLWIFFILDEENEKKKKNVIKL